MTPLGLFAFALMAVAWLFAAVMLVANYLRTSPERRFSGPPEGRDASAAPGQGADKGGPLAGVSGDRAHAWPGPVLPPSDALAGRSLRRRQRGAKILDPSTGETHTLEDGKPVIVGQVAFLTPKDWESHRRHGARLAGDLAMAREERDAAMAARNISDADHARNLASRARQDAALSGLARHEAADWPNWTRRHPEGPDNDQDPGQPWRPE